MKRFLAGGIALIFLAALAAAIPVRAEDAPPAQVPAASGSWTGLYVGPHVAAGGGTATFSNPFGPSIYGDAVSTPAFGGGAQLGYNWQVPGARWVLGAEADVSGLVSDGTRTCLAASSFFVSANCRVHPDLATTVTARVGYAAGPEGRSLLYLKGGLAGLQETVSLTTNGQSPALAESHNVWKWGGTVGAGVEQALTPAWSLKLEYAFLGFPGSSVSTPTGSLQVAAPAAQYVSTAPVTSSLGQTMHMVKLGVNYRFGNDPRTRWAVDSASGSAPPKAAMGLGWEAELGGRAWFSSGRFQKDLGAGTVPSQQNLLASRLTYDTTVPAGEVFGRVESPWNVFVKGFVGAGGITSGTLNDEDWQAFNGTVPYSNTRSKAVGTIDYATADLGYNLFRDPDYKLGLFVGYTYYTENKTGYGCTQLSNVNSDCAPSIPRWVPVIAENNTWQSLRVGANGEVRLMDSLKLGADIAYLPYVAFSGTDNHRLRELISPEWGKGNGVQLETVLSYYVTPGFSIGVGGRYWAMWTTDAYTAFGGAPCPCLTLPAKAERYGVFVQASYRFAQSAGPAKD